MLQKSMNMDIQMVGTSNQLYIRGSSTETKFSKKESTELLAKLHFVLPILFVLTLASDRAVLYGNVMLSVLVLSTKKQYSSFLKRVCVFQKIYFKVKVLKSFKISSDCHIKACRSLKWRAILKIPSTIFQKNLCSFCWL